MGVNEKGKNKAMKFCQNNPPANLFLEEPIPVNKVSTVNEHYRRMYTFYNQYSNTIITSGGLLGTANFTAYAFIYKSDTTALGSVLLSLIVFFVDFVISYGLWSHIRLQGFFSKRYLKIDTEVYKVTDPVPLGGGMNAKNVYIAYSIVMLLISLLVVGHRLFLYPNKEGKADEYLASILYHIWDFCWVTLYMSGVVIGSAAIALSVMWLVKKIYNWW